MSQSGSAAKTFVEYKRGPVSGQEEYLDPDTALCAKCTSLYPTFFQASIGPFLLVTGTCNTSRLYS
jgi:hypothetical protein